MQTQTEHEPEQTTAQPLSPQTGEANTESETESDPENTRDSSIANADLVKAITVVAKLKCQARTRWYLNFVYAAVLIGTLVTLPQTSPGSPSLGMTYWSIVMVVSGLFYLVAWLQMRQANKVIANINDVKLVGRWPRRWTRNAL